MNRDPALIARGFRTLGGIDAGLTLWSAEARLRGGAARQLVLQNGHSLGVTAIAFAPDGDRMVTGGGDSTIRLWLAGDRTLLRAFSPHLVGVTALSLSPGGRFLASGDGSGRVRLWDFRDGTEVVTGPPLETGVEVAAFLIDSPRFATFERGARSGCTRRPPRNHPYCSRPTAGPWRSPRRRGRSLSPWPTGAGKSERSTRLARPWAPSTAPAGS